ncbi:MAG TPA: glycerol-3-phosphate 1-O-acyltransferase PlsY [Thermoplasmata archaeon]|nr:glycerol-3-phosphate 1-O-acyltransferase PlsY [Thermoplasmata archaeon]HIH98833.1 glycerol-3-phosphate 1-O-acyltransferase PlsY [Thermoplasmata archaeon]
MSSLVFALLIALSYLIGSIPVGYLLVKRKKGVDLRKHGSGNIGGANVSRLLGKRWGIFSGLGDAAKGWFPTFLAISLSAPPLIIVGVAFAAILGHCFPPWLKFKGGKGMSTLMGALLAISPLSFIILLCVWALALKLTNISSVSNFCFVGASPFTLYLTRLLTLSHPSLYQLYPLEQSLLFTYFSIALIPLILYTHWSNIKRIMEGKERKFGELIEVGEGRNE